MTRTITLRLSDEAYEIVKRYSDADSTSMNSWVEHVLDAEDTRRRCEAHSRWVAANPHISQMAIDMHTARHQELADAGLTGILGGTE